jgi:hypothetical protein
MSTTSGYRPQPNRSKLGVFWVQPLMRAATDYWVQPPKTSTVRDKYNATTVQYSHRLLSGTTHNAKTITCKQRWVYTLYSPSLLSATTPNIIDCKNRRECNHIILLSATTARTATGYHAPSTPCYWLGRGQWLRLWLSAALRTPRNRRAQWDGTAWRKKT